MSTPASGWASSGRPARASRRCSTSSARSIAVARSRLWPATTSTPPTTAGSPGAGDPDRLRLPAVLPDRRDDLARERRGGLLYRGAPLQRRTAAAGAPRAGRARPSPGPPPREALRRRAPARRDRQRPGRWAGNRVRRRADREPDSRAGADPGPPARAPRRGDDDDGDHARPRDRGSLPRQVALRDGRVVAPRPRACCPPTCCASGRSACSAAACAPSSRPRGRHRHREMVGVLGLSESSRAGLLPRWTASGPTCSLPAGPGSAGATRPFPRARAGLRRLGGVQRSTRCAGRRDRAPERPGSGGTSGVTVEAADLAWCRPSARMAAGGCSTPRRAAGRRARRGRSRAVGIDRPGPMVWPGAGGRWWGLDPFELAPELDRTVLMGSDAAGASTPPSAGDHLSARRPVARAPGTLVPATADPENPDQVEVSRPSDAIAAKAAASTRSRACSSGSGPSRCWSAASASRTSWSSRSSSVDPRSACGGRSAPRVGT